MPFRTLFLRKKFPIVPTRALISRLALFIIGAVTALHPSSKAGAPPVPALGLKNLPNIREVCTSSTDRTKTCLKASLIYRCYNYGNFSIFQGEKIDECVAAVSKMIDIMNIVQVHVSDEFQNLNDPVEKSGLALKQVLFQKDLFRIFRDPKTASLFEAAQASLDDSIQFNREHNLWDSVFIKTGSNREKTLEFIAEGLQDVSEGVGNLTYLGGLYEAAKLSETSAQVINLNAAGMFVNYYQLNLGKGVPFSAYPAINGVGGKLPRIDKTLHPFLHHFYLPAILSFKLKKVGLKDEDAFFAAFLLNTAYEIVKLEAYIGSNRWPFHDPKPFEVSNKYNAQEELQKIYSGYVGALWGIGQEKNAKSLNDFSKEFASHPYQSMRGYFNSNFKSALKP